MQAGSARLFIPQLLTVSKSLVQRNEIQQLRRSFRTSRFSFIRRLVISPVHDQPSDFAIIRRLSNNRVVESSSRPAIVCAATGRDNLRRESECFGSRCRYSGLARYRSGGQTCKIRRLFRGRLLAHSLEFFACCRHLPLSPGLANLRAPSRFRGTRRQVQAVTNHVVCDPVLVVGVYLEFPAESLRALLPGE